MFQRQTRQPFPFRNIIVLFAIVLGFFWYVYSHMKHAPEPVKQVQEKEAGLEKRDSGLWPSEWFFLVREYPDYKTNVNTFTQAMSEAADAVSYRNGNPGFSAPWTVQGPGNIGGRVNTIKIHPTNPNIIYIGYSTGGVWKTTNGGASWTPIFDQQPFLAIGDIELDPQNPNIVYVGTGDPNIGGYPFIGDGLWKSPDGGQTWQHLGLTAQRIISKIVVHPTNPNIIYIAAMGLPFQRDNYRGLYKTTDGGQTWQQILFISNQAGVIDLQMAPNNPNVLYAAAWDRIRNNQESLVSGPDARIWKTTNGGTDWTMLSGGLPTSDRSRIGLDIDKQNPNHVVAIYAKTDLTYDKTYETFNAGQTWQPMDTTSIDPNFQSNFSWYFGKVFINPYNPQMILMCGVELWGSFDGGASWSRVSPEWWMYVVHADTHDVAFVNATTFLLATDGGLYRTSDSGANWDKIENNPITQLYRVAFSPFQPANYYGGAQDNGTSGSNKDSITNWPRIYGGDGFQPAFHPTDPNIFYCETQNGGMVVSLDGSANFFDATGGIDATDRRSWDMQYIFSHQDPEIMYTGTYRVYMKISHPGVWDTISPDLTNGVAGGERYHNITTLDDSPVNPALLYVGTSDGNVWHGNPTTQTWVNVSAGLPNRYVSCVKASALAAKRVFVSVTGYKDNDFTPHIYRSENQGANWTPVSGDLPNFAVNDLLILPGHQDSIIVAATDGGVYATINGGIHWERLGTGMPFVPVYDIEINPAKKTVFAGTFGRSIYSFPLDSLIHGGDVSTYTPPAIKSPEMHVLPSLVYDHAKIQVENLKPRESVDVIICDLNGRIVWHETFSGYQQQEKSIDVGSLTSGVYVAFARTNDNIWARQKFVIAH
jgi:photosystem II stability/assembly factor-like uncharacterized protein